MDSLKPPSPIDFHSGNVADSWQRWKRQFEIYFAAAKLNKKAKATQEAILLHAAGPEAQDIHRAFSWSEAEDKHCYKTFLQKFTDYCEPRKNVVFERYEFWALDQRSTESVDAWLTDLRNAASKCEFGEQENSLIRDKIVFGVRDNALKERLLREPKLTLDKALDICRAAETSREQLRHMNKEAEAGIAKLALHDGSTKSSQPPSPYINNAKHYGNVHKTNTHVINCDFCGYDHERARCPAYGKTCSKCKGKNHFASVCKGGGFRRRGQRQAADKQPRRPHQGDKRHVTVSTLHDNANDYASSYDDDGDLLFVGKLFDEQSAHVHDKWHETLVVNGQNINFKLDTGADANIMPMTQYKQLLMYDKSESENLLNTSQSLTAFGGSKVQPYGKIIFPTYCPLTDNTHNVQYYITDTSDEPILGKNACEAFKLVHRTTNVEFVNINVMSDKSYDSLTEESLVTEYTDVFSGLGKYEEPYKIMIDTDVPPVIQRNRKVPFAKLPALKKALDQLEQDDIIASVDQPTPWVNNLVITEKRDGSLRLCLDPKPLNTAIKRENHNIPTADDVQYQLSGKSVFTVVDMKDSYWHVALDDESSYLCTFHTPWGRKRFKRMPFGISSASEVMQ